MGGISEAYGEPVENHGIFNVAAYFIFLREALEAAIIIAVLITFVNKIVDNEELRKRLVRQVWLGSLTALTLCIALGVVFIIIFQTVKLDIWGSSFEQIWEAVFMLIAVVLITIMAFTMIKVEHWQLKWEKKLANAAAEAVSEVNTKRWVMAFLPFTVVLREGLESMVLLGGTAEAFQASSVILPAITGILTGLLLGYAVFRTGNMLMLQRFIFVSTVFLLFVAAGVFTGACHEIEELAGESPVLWEIEDPAFDQEKNGFFMVLNALFGWRNEATVVTTVAYFGYWLVVGTGLWFYSRHVDKQVYLLTEKNDANVEAATSTSPTP